MSILINKTIKELTHVFYMENIKIKKTYIVFLCFVLIIMTTFILIINRDLIINRKDCNLKENLTSEILPTSNPIVDITVTKKYSELSGNNFFLTSPLISKLSGLYYGYPNGVERFSSDITEEVKSRYPAIKYYPDQIYYTPFTVDIWSYYYDTYHYWWQKKNNSYRDNTNFSFQVNGKTVFADIGIRPGKNNYPTLTFKNLKQSLRNVYDIDGTVFKNSIFVLDRRVIVIEWNPGVPVVNGYDDHSTLLATMYAENPNKDSLTNAVQLRVVMPAFDEVVEDVNDWPKKSETPDPNNIGTQKLQKVIDSYLESIIKVLNEIKYYQ